MDWLCPGYSEVLYQQLMKYYGKISPKITIRDIVSIVQTGSTHVAIYDLTNNVMYTSVAKTDAQSGPANAFDRWAS